MIGYETLIVGLAIFLIFHLASGVYELRTKLVNMMGLMMFRMTHSLISLGGLVLIVMGFGEAPKEQLYAVSEWGPKAPIVLMPIALVLLAGSGVNSDIKRITRHPMLWGIVLWSFSHLIANGEKSSVIMFGTFFIYGLLAMKLTDDKKAKTDPEEWEKIKATTSVIPFVALFAKRSGPARGDYGLKAVIMGLFIYSLLLWTHGYFAGIPLIKL